MLPVYEFAITFDQEVAAVWTCSKKLSFGSFLLVSTRWCLVLAAVIACLPPKITVRHRLSYLLSTHLDTLVAAGVCMVYFSGHIVFLNYSKL